jgi:predicted NUDIX family phosphoesterase
MKTQSPSENLVLCAVRNSLPADWLGERVSIRIDFNEVLEMIRDVPLEWLEREDAEANEAFKQWIPYALLMNEIGMVAMYPRQGTETRLHGVWSVGVGGHVHPHDGATWEQALLNGLNREILEEYDGAVIGSPVMLGLINEEQTHLGKVHIGAVFLQRCMGQVAQNSNELAGLEWVAPEDIGNLLPGSMFERWSLLAMELAAAHDGGLLAGTQ